MANIEQKLHIEDDAFLGMRQDANKVMQKLIENMVEKETLEGSVTIKIDVKINTDYILNMDKTASSEHRKVMNILLGSCGKIFYQSSVALIRNQSGTETVAVVILSMETIQRRYTTRLRNLNMAGKWLRTVTESTQELWELQHGRN